MLVRALAVVAALWGLLIVYGQLHCSVFETWCPGSEVDAWTGAFIAAPFGLLAMFGLSLMAIIRLFRSSQAKT